MEAAAERGSPRQQVHGDEVEEVEECAASSKLGVGDDVHVREDLCGHARDEE